jgi:hypothetical protein
MSRTEGERLEDEGVEGSVQAIFCGRHRGLSCLLSGLGMVTP